MAILTVMLETFIDHSMRFDAVEFFIQKAKKGVKNRCFSNRPKNIEVLKKISMKLFMK